MTSFNGQQNSKLQSKTLVVYHNNSKSCTKTKEHVYIQPEHLANIHRTTERRPSSKRYELLLKQEDSDDTQEYFGQVVSGDSDHDEDRNSKSNDESDDKENTASGSNCKNINNDDSTHFEYGITKNKNAICHVHFSNEIKKSSNKRKSSLMSSSKTQREYQNGLKNVCMIHLSLSRNH